MSHWCNVKFKVIFIALQLNIKTKSIITEEALLTYGRMFTKLKIRFNLFAQKRLLKAGA